MAESASLRDIVIVLPGIGGSALRWQGKPLWEPRLGAVRTLVESMDAFGEALGSAPHLLDDPEADLDVVPIGLAQTPVVLPFLAKLSPYRAMREMIERRFDVVRGDPLVDGPPANYFEFAYDWRRDNRVSAWKLRHLIDRELPKWESTLEGGRSRVILLAHSMGGLVAKYYLDVLDGWRHCRSLITFGTPFRGSVKALDVLANGYRKLGRDIAPISDVLGRFTSVYQLLPMYPIVHDRRTDANSAGLRRVSELEAGVGKLDRTRARDAYEFQRSITKLDHLERLAPVVGHGLPTPQSATLLDGGLHIGHSDTPALAGPAWLNSGDGTVPVRSAIPVGYPEHLVRLCDNASHSTLHTSTGGLDMVANMLDLLQVGLDDFQDLPSTRPPDGPRTSPEQSVLTLSVEDLHYAGEPVVVRCSSSDPTEHLQAEMTALTPGGSPARRVDLTESAWSVEALRPGTYGVSVTGRTHTVSDVFEVL